MDASLHKAFEFVSSPLLQGGGSSWKIKTGSFYMCLFIYLFFLQTDRVGPVSERRTLPGLVQTHFSTGQLPQGRGPEAPRQSGDIFTHTPALRTEGCCGQHLRSFMLCVCALYHTLTCPRVTLENKPSWCFSNFETTKWINLKSKYFYYEEVKWASHKSKLLIVRPVRGVDSRILGLFGFWHRKDEPRV